MTDQPHILLITSDQHRADFLGCAGHPIVRTPHLDQLAREGTRFSRASSECPVCIPARTAMISGIHPATYGMPSYAADFRLERPREQLLGGMLTAAGYQTALVGKRHWHRDPTCTAGFENVVPIERCKRAQSLACDGWGFPTGTGANELSPACSPLPESLYSTNWTIDRCCEVLAERDQTRPLALWCSLVDPHPPLAIHEPYYSMYRGCEFPAANVGSWVDSSEACPRSHHQHRHAWGGRVKEAERQDAAAVYAGMITNIDHQLGRLFGMLQRLGLYDNTLIVYTTDHGEMLGDHADAGKSSFYRSSSDIPFLVRPPRTWNAPVGEESDALVGLADLLPTLVAAAGGMLPDDIDGVDLGPLARGERSAPRDAFIGAIDSRYLVDDGRHRWLYHTDDGRQQLFAVSDRNETDPLPLDPDVVTPLQERLIAWLDQRGQRDLVEGRLANHQLPTPSIPIARSHGPTGLGHAGRYLDFEGPV